MVTLPWNFPFKEKKTGIKETGERILDLIPEEEIDDFVEEMALFEVAVVKGISKVEEFLCQEKQDDRKSDNKRD